MIIIVLHILLFIQASGIQGRGGGQTFCMGGQKYFAHLHRKVPSCLHVDLQNPPPQPVNNKWDSDFTCCDRATITFTIRKQSITIQKDHRIKPKLREWMDLDSGDPFYWISAKSLICAAHSWEIQLRSNSEDLIIKIQSLSFCLKLLPVSSGKVFKKH